MIRDSPGAKKFWICYNSLKKILKEYIFIKMKHVVPYAWELRLRLSGTGNHQTYYQMYCQSYVMREAGRTWRCCKLCINMVNTCLLFLGLHHFAYQGFPTSLYPLFLSRLIITSLVLEVMLKR
jgi:hypothetical protein